MCEKIISEIPHMREITAERGLVEVYTSPLLVESLVRLVEVREDIGNFSLGQKTVDIYRREHGLPDNIGPLFYGLVTGGLGIYLQELPDLIKQREIALSPCTEQRRALVEQNSLLTSRRILAQRLDQEENPTQKTGITEMLARIDASVKVRSV